MSSSRPSGSRGYTDAALHGRALFDLPVPALQMAVIAELEADQRSDVQPGEGPPSMSSFEYRQLNKDNTEADQIDTVASLIRDSNPTA